MTKLFAISAPSGSGKTTLCRMLVADIPNLRLSISSTSRAPRGAEVDGKDYFFLSKDDFKKEIDNDRFAEWAEVHGNYYGTSKKVVEDAIDGGYSLLLDIDVQGAESLRKVYPELSYSIFILPPNLTILEQRLRERGTDSEEVIQKRLQNARDELQCKSQFDKTILNDQLERAYQELKDTVAEVIYGDKD